MPPSPKVISLLLKDSRNSSTNSYFFSSVKVLITIKKARNKVASAVYKNKNMPGGLYQISFSKHRCAEIFNLHLFL